MNYKNVLIVDDDLDDHLILKEAINYLNLQPYFYFYHSPVNALRDLKNGLLKVELILLDINMPFMNGIEFLSEVKADPFLKNTDVIMSTTTNDSISKRTCHELGARHFLIKPNSFSELLEQLKRIFI